jgi:hypothetical protein
MRPATLGWRRMLRLIRKILYVAVDPEISFTIDGVRLSSLIALIPDPIDSEKEGYARAYLKIAGVWEDHTLRSLINPRSK